MYRNKRHFNKERRHFIKKIAIGSSAILFSFGLPIFSISSSAEDGKPDQLASILIDFSKCTGCRTCEAICSSFNNLENIDESLMPGIGNPYHANIKVYNYNPDIDVPSVCSLCSDAPCIQACPISEDPVTNRKALFRDNKTNAIVSDPTRCIGCGNCQEACKNESAGIIRLNRATGMPEGICNLCGGDPQCVKHCPYGALRFEKQTINYSFDRMSPDEIAKQLTKQNYLI